MFPFTFLHSRYLQIVNFMFGVSMKQTIQLLQAQRNYHNSQRKQYWVFSLGLCYDLALSTKQFALEPFEVLDFLATVLARLISSCFPILTKQAPAFNSLWEVHGRYPRNWSSAHQIRRPQAPIFTFSTCNACLREEEKEPRIVISSCYAMICRSLSLSFSFSLSLSSC